MILDHSESSQHAITSWHQCPVCKQVRMTSDPKAGKASLAVSTRKDEDSRYSAEPDVLQPESNHGYAAYLMT